MRLVIKTTYETDEKKHFYIAQYYSSGAPIRDTDTGKAEDPGVKDQVEANKLRRIRVNDDNNEARFLAGPGWVG